MSVIPPTKAELITFCDQHIKTWTSAPPASIGLTAAQITGLSTLLTTANNGVDAIVATREAAKAATLSSDLSASSLRSAAADLVRTIKNYAESTNNPNVYVLAQIPPPAAPSPVPAPGQPTNLKASLEPSGAVTISWKAVNPVGGSGTVYTIKRKLSTQTAYVVLGSTGGRAKKFTDTTLPSGSNNVQYIVFGQRSDSTGPQSEVLTVMFGVGGGGFAFTVTPNDQGDESETRLAA